MSLCQCHAVFVSLCHCLSVSLRHCLSQLNLTSFCHLSLPGRVQEVELEEEVDVIVSEWMGYMLLYEV